MNLLEAFASSLCDETKWHAANNQNSKSIILKAGHLSMIFDNGSLRYISNGNCEIIRMIYASVRDKEWLTIKPVISDEDFAVKTDSFRIRYSCQYTSGNINFLAHYLIEGKADNSVIFSFDGEALNSFEKNRIGFCVLHPINNYAGETCQIIHSNDVSENLRFPDSISPDQPFYDIKSMKWKISGQDCSLDFFGDVFETEDQRNWTDASFKTYSTPLKIPYPVKIDKGVNISQRIELRIKAEAEVEVDKGTVLLRLYPEKMMRLPAIGIGRSTRKTLITDSEIKILEELRFDHYRVNIFLFSGNWKNNAEASVSEAERLSYPLEFALFFDDNFQDQVAEFIVWMKIRQPNISVINIFHKLYPATPGSIINIVSPILKKVLPHVNVGCGTNANFAQLNRNRPESDLFDNLIYSIQPQEHASDNITLVENLQGQGYTAESAKLFCNGKRIWVSPVTIQRRFNANKENYEQTLSYRSLPAQIDSRLMSLLGASWTAASIKYLSETGVEGITYFETVGERGIIQGDFPSRWPKDFKSVKGMIFPSYHLFKYVLDSKSFEVIGSQSSAPLKIDILALLNGINLKIILMNFTGVIQSVMLKDISGEFRMKQLNAGNFAEAVSDLNWYHDTSTIQIDPEEKLLLEPFSLSFIEGKVRT